ncbi:hypothetical protein REPUB_Repub17cG0043000 [Reevesia pubescens]
MSKCITLIFHACATKRQCTNKISRLKDDNEVWHSDQESIEDLVVDYFQKLYDTSNPMNIDLVTGSVPLKLTVSMKAVLETEFTLDEITIALYQMNPTKSPKSDGMTVGFYQSYWHIVGCDVSHLIFFPDRGFDASSKQLLDYEKRLAKETPITASSTATSNFNATAENDENKSTAPQEFITPFAKTNNNLPIFVIGSTRKNLLLTDHVS